MLHVWQQYNTDFVVAHRAHPENTMIVRNEDLILSLETQVRQVLRRAGFPSRAFNASLLADYYAKWDHGPQSYKSIKAEYRYERASSFRGKIASSLERWVVRQQQALREKYRPPRGCPMPVLRTRRPDGTFDFRTLTHTTLYGDDISACRFPELNYCVAKNCSDTSYHAPGPLSMHAQRAAEMASAAHARRVAARRSGTATGQQRVPPAAMDGGGGTTESFGPQTLLPAELRRTGPHRSPPNRPGASPGWQHRPETRYVTRPPARPVRLRPGTAGTAGMVRRRRYVIRGRAEGWR